MSNGQTKTPEVIDVVQVPNEPMTSVARNEIEAQIDAAHKHPRDMVKFLASAKLMATLSEDIAESCLYTLERWDAKLRKKVPLVGKSVRLAEICMSAWGNCHAGARPVEEAQRFVRAQGVCWDVERNVRVTMEATRGITKADGGRYGNDMIITTMNAAASIALRNAILRVIPAALTEEVFQAARAAAIGEAPSKRAKIIKRLAALGAPVDRVLAAIDRKAIEEITIEDMEVLIGYGSAIKEGDKTVDECFPPIAQTSPASQPAAQPTQPPVQQPQAETKHAAPAAQGHPSLSAAAATPAVQPKPGQQTIASLTQRSKAGRAAAVAAGDDGGVISRPNLQSVPPQVPPEDPEDAANRAAAAPTEDEMPEWSR